MTTLARQMTLEAARSLSSERKNIDRERIYRFIAVQGAVGSTDDETQEYLGMSGNTERPRRGELVAKGRIVASGRTRPTRSGRRATVWIAT